MPYTIPEEGRYVPRKATSPSVPRVDMSMATAEIFSTLLQLATPMMMLRMELLQEADAELSCKEQ